MASSKQGWLAVSAGLVGHAAKRAPSLETAGSPDRCQQKEARMNREEQLEPYRLGQLKSGSSHFPGERGLDFQEEVARVAKSIGHALDDLDAVVHPLDEAGVLWKARAGEDAPGVSAQVAGKALQRR